MPHLATGMQEGQGFRDAGIQGSWLETGEGGGGGC